MLHFISPKCLFYYTLLLLIVLQTKVVLCTVHKVGDLNSWTIPSASNPDVYAKWSKHNVFRVKDSLLFLYPPSQDSVIQLTPQAYKSCDIKDPILSMNDGNSLFNITKPGEYYFTSGEEGHCEKGQKLQISIAGDGAIVYAPSEGPGAMSDTADSPSYQQAFGSIPTASDASSSMIRFSVFSFIGFAIWWVVTCTWLN